MLHVDLEGGWALVAGTDGLEVRILNEDFDEGTTRGHRIRLVRFAAVGRTFEPYQHTYWKEVYLVSGEITILDDRIPSDCITTLTISEVFLHVRE